MASIIDKFNNSVIGSNNSISDYNCIIAPIGDFTRITGVNVLEKISTFCVSLNPVLVTFLFCFFFNPAFTVDVCVYFIVLAMS